MKIRIYKTNRDDRWIVILQNISWYLLLSKPSEYKHVNRKLFHNKADKSDNRLAALLTKKSRFYAGTDTSTI